MERPGHHRAEREQRVVRHGEQREPPRPRHAADDGGGHDRRDAAGEERGRREAVDRGQREHHGLHDARPGGDLGLPEDFLVDVHEDARPRGGGGQDESQHRHGQHELDVHRERPPARPVEDVARDPLGEAALRHGDAERQDANQEVRHGAREALERLAEALRRAREREQRDPEQRGRSRVEPARGPEDDGDQRDEERPLAGEREALEEGRQQEREPERAHDQGGQAGLARGRSVEVGLAIERHPGHGRLAGSYAGTRQPRPGNGFAGRCYNFARPAPT